MEASHPLDAYSQIVSGVAAANPDAVVSGTQSEDAFAQVKAMIQLKWLLDAPSGIG